MSNLDSAPSNYIEKVSLATGDILDSEIAPEQLLVQHYRDYHIVDTYARSLLGWLVRGTGDESKSRQFMHQLREIGKSTAGFIGKALGKDPQKLSETLFGLRERDFYFRFKRHPFSAEEIQARIQELKQRATEKLAEAPIRILLTGGSGFVGKEILWQASQNEALKEIVVLMRPKIVKHRLTGEILESWTVEQRGITLLEEVGIEDAALAKFRFVDGDIEKPNLGISAADFEELKTTITHVIHCAASVAFDDPYDSSFSSNVLGSQNALSFSEQLQEAPGSKFVAHLSVETSYIHGKQTRQVAREDEVVFPRNFYNNYYELTKAIASLETERWMLEKGLRVIQLCPSIVIGEARTGNNRGDQKVVNAPVNAWGRARKAIRESQGDWVRRSQAEMLFRMARIFPGDPSAELNLIPVDWVARGILAATTRPHAVGERVHLATDNRITAALMKDIVRKELRLDIKFAEPTTHKHLQLPMISKVLKTVQQDRIAKGLAKLGSIFGGYSELGQPVHQVGNDVELLGMPLPRPSTKDAFIMLCRHNKYVQDFGSVKDPLELSRRERLWTLFIDEIEEETGSPAAHLPAKEFVNRFFQRFDRDTFEMQIRDFV